MTSDRGPMILRIVSVQRLHHVIQQTVITKSIIISIMLTDKTQENCLAKDFSVLDAIIMRNSCAWCVKFNLMSAIDN